MSRTRSPWLSFLLTLLVAGCPEPESGWTWSIVAEELPAALLSVSGRSSSDVWAVGADAGDGPLVLHYDGRAWQRLATGHTGHLWWVHAFADGSAMMGGANGAILRYSGGVFTRMATPGLGRDTVFGIWGSSPTDVYAVGGAANRAGFIWRYDGASWESLPLPANIPLLTFAGWGGDVPRDLPGLFKVWGDGLGTVWVVGAAGTVLRSVDGAAFEVVPSGLGTDATLFTISGNATEQVIVGGAANGLLLEGRGTQLRGRTPSGAGLIQGISVPLSGDPWASGFRGSMFRRSNGTWLEVDTELDYATSIQSLHATWVDPEGGVWAVGGDVLSADLRNGALIHYGAPVAPVELPSPTDAGTQDAGPADGGTPAPRLCPEAEIDSEPTASIARRWNEQQLNAIRRTVPMPGVHARNLYHVSAAMWDAWATFQATADGVYYRERHTAPDVDAARREAISYAAFRVLNVRYSAPLAVRGPVNRDCFRAFMSRLGYDPDDQVIEGNSPRAIGNRIGAAVLAATVNDGANEAGAYADTTGYRAENPPLVLDVPGGVVPYPSVWQQLNLSESATQNGIILPSGLQPYIGPNWRDVTPFALTETGRQMLDRMGMRQPTFEDPSNPTQPSAAMRDWLVQVIRAEAQLDVDPARTIDISPGAYGNNTLGTNDNRGHDTNPVTGRPYSANIVPEGDFYRVLAEFWADGPRSETPPGHWNTLANNVADAPLHRRCLAGTPAFDTCIAGTTPELDALAWDVHVYLALNGAVHDAAIAAWGIKRDFLASRPVTMIRHMAARGQSTDRSLASYHAEGLPLVPGLIEVITTETTRPGQRHAQLVQFIGEIAIRGWPGEPSDRAVQVAPIRWMRGRDWLPYQRRNFVTPAFPGFISGHSTFSRAAAEVLAELNGSPYFPGGMGSFTARRGEYLVFEDGPSVDVRLEWATYYDAADQAGQSRIWGGIHIEADDFVGRRIGSQVGLRAVQRAREYFVGAVAP